MNRLLFVVLLLINGGVDLRARTRRDLPFPLPNHPGNVFLAGENVEVSRPGLGEASWQAVDYDSNVIAAGRGGADSIQLGRLPVGYYELQVAFNGATNTCSIGVVEPLRAPTPPTSPISIDVAAAWLVPATNLQATASLCALAGINWVRDRLNWEEMEPARGQIAGSNRYDFSISRQAEAGLQILQVSHRSPSWATPKPQRFPLDLRDAYEYHRALANRWREKVSAFEPWNEADIAMFGGHTGSEMASYQKASYLGLKKGNPKVIAGMNVFALHRKSTLEDFAANEAWPYFDTFNLHHYEPFASYPGIYSAFRAVSAGKPLWVTECSLPVKWAGDEKLQEPAREDLRVQSERVPITFARTLHEGAQAVFYFILPHYLEGPTQFGILRRDLTPRPAFVALAAAGRLLADARPLGRLRSSSVQGYAFSARPDGRRLQVLVVWSETGSEFKPPAQPTGCFDHLGRKLSLKDGRVRLGQAPVYILLPVRTQLGLDAPPAAPALRRGQASELVLQALLPEQTLELEESAYRVTSGQAVEVPLFLYNFGSRIAKGALKASLPSGWTADLPPRFEIQPGKRTKLPVTLAAPPKGDPEILTLRFECDGGRAGTALVSMRFLVR